MIIEFIDNPIYDDLYANHVEKRSEVDTKMDHRGFKQMITAFYNTEVETIDEKEEVIKECKNIKIVPSIIFDSYYKEMKVEFKLGLDKFYKIKSLSDFIQVC